MNISQIQENLKKVLGDLNREEFIYELLNAYGKPKASISRLKNGTYNLSKNANEVLWKKEVFFKYTSSGNLHSTIDALRNDDLVKRHKPRFLIVTDFDLLLAIDTKTQETLDINLNLLDKSFDFFLPWANMEKTQNQDENPADVKAAEKMAKLYDEILKDNLTNSKNDIHRLNVFLTRLLFCFFAEDTNIFPKNSFTNSVNSHTQHDGSDLKDYLNTLFEALNNPDREGFPEYLKSFPYVNGGLFTQEIYVPNFSRRSRSMIIESGELDWSSINPDIFGSMFQAVVHTEQRAEMGMHYTSVPNILKLIDPLFMNELREEFIRSIDSEAKLEQLLYRLENIKIFDPACGSGNFLIIAYKELRKLEMQVLKRLKEISKVNKGLRFSNISLSQFYGIELDDFAHEIAILSLWLAEHQMNINFKELFGAVFAALPLKKGGNIVCNNATQIDWEDVCPTANQAEIYVLGNPPYKGARRQEDYHKEDIQNVFENSDVKNYKNLDYISCWFYKGVRYINSKSKMAFVSTSSICQGEQVGILWQELIKNAEINFAVQPFKWSNNAKKNAAVYCVIVGLSKNNNQKWLFSNSTAHSVENISPYLIEGANTVVEKRNSPLSKLPKMGIGNKPVDGGNYLFNESEKNAFILDEPKSEKLFFKWYGAEEFLGDKKRWCLLAKDITDDELVTLPKTKELILKVQQSRLASDSKPTIKLAETPKKFHVENFPKNNYMVIPKVSSSENMYIPVGIFEPNMISSDLLNVIDSNDPIVFGLVSSKLHMIWVNYISGRFGNSYRYSSSICYNTFPVPLLNNSQAEIISKCVYELLATRQNYTEKTLSEIYSKQMPQDLYQAHQNLDIAVEGCYAIKKSFTEEEKLERLFNLYTEMISKEKSK